MLTGIALPIQTERWEAPMSDENKNDLENKDDLTVVPIPATDTEEDHRHVRESNDRDQQDERSGKHPRHNLGYDEAADGKPEPKIERVVDE